MKEYYAELGSFTEAIREHEPSRIHISQRPRHFLPRALEAGFADSEGEVHYHYFQYSTKRDLRYLRHAIEDADALEVDGLVYERDGQTIHLFRPNNKRGKPWILYPHKETLHTWMAAVAGCEEEDLEIQYANDMERTLLTATDGETSYVAVIHEDLHAEEIVQELFPHLPIEDHSSFVSWYGKLPHRFR